MPPGSPSDDVPTSAGDDVAPAPDARPVPVSPRRLPMPPAAPARDDPPPPPVAVPLDVHREDAPLAAAALLLALSTLLPWYRGLDGATTTGFASGTWGPVVFFLALASVALIALRRAGVRVSLPVEESLVHEAIGLIALVGCVLKLWMRPSASGLRVDPAWGVWAALALAAVVALLGGRLGPAAPLVARPGWYRGSAGRIGAAVLGLADAGSVVGIGVLANDADPALSREPARATPPRLLTVRNRLPECARGIPVPPGARPFLGFEPTTPQGPCLVQLRSSGTPDALAAAYERELRRLGWKFRRASGETPFPSFVLRGPACGTLTIVPGLEDGSIAALSLTPCTP